MADSSNSLYRKYRPSNFLDVAGHKNIVEILETELKNKNFSHAYLFAGQRGTGKTSIARILAKAINCLDLQNGNPCDKCENCLAFDKNQFPDVYEIDAASNNGVDEIRNVKNNVQTLPIVGKYKIYIIDEVHMLTKGAFNALLKTLEEPPVHVVFILATTEYDKIPATIISRCQTFSFKKISDEDLIERLNFISKNEGFNLEQEAANEIYDISEGSLRDALNVLEQLMVVCDETKNITINDIKKIFYVATKNEKLQVIKDILDSKSQKVIDYFEQAKRQGMDFNVFTLALIKIIKEIIEFKLTNNENFLDVINKEDIKKFDDSSVSELFNIADNLTDAYIKTKNNNASFDYILLSVLKTIKSNDEIVKPVNEAQEVKQYDFEEEKPSVQPEIKLEVEQPEQKVEEQTEPTNGIQNDTQQVDQPEKENIFEEWENKTLDADIEADNEVKVDDNIDEPDVEKNITLTMGDINDNNDDSTIDEPIETISEVEQSNNTIEPNNSLLEADNQPTIEEVEKIEAETPVELYNQQIDLTNKDDSKRDISFLVNDIINVLMGVIVDRNPNLRHTLNEKMNSIFEVDDNGKFRNKDIANEFVSLINANVVAANNNEAIVQTDTLTQANFVNKELTNIQKRNDLMNILGDDYVIYAISKKDWTNAKSTFKELKEKRLLPEYEIIDNNSFYKANTKKIASLEDERDKELLKKATQLFDVDDIEIGD